MDIVMVSAECAPVAKAGGLGDFIQGLAHELLRRGEQVEVFLPHYDVLPVDQIAERRVCDRLLPVSYRGERLDCRLTTGRIDGIPCVLFEPRSPQHFFERGRIYGEPDDAERFACFARAVVDYLHDRARCPDILHCHDWHTALTLILARQQAAALGLAGSSLCYTLHNLAYQGRVEADLLGRVGLDAASAVASGMLADPGDPGRVNLMRGAIECADFVNTVSPRYAWEVQSTAQGMGLESVLRAQADKFAGILNGIDARVWSPAVDPLIPANYGPDTLGDKALNRRALRARLGLAEADKPIVAVVSRLDRQKGVALMLHGIQSVLDWGGQMVVLGSAMDPQIQAQFAQLAADTAAGAECRIQVSYDEGLAHLIFAGSDILLVPSVYEPCGLTQMIAMTYGTVPVVRRVGGLADTVVDAHFSDRPFAARNGFVFDELSGAGLDSALGRALALWQRSPEHFRQLRLNGMRGDYSWRVPAEEYLALFRLLRSPPGAD